MRPKGLKKYDYTIYMTTLPKRDLKTSSYKMDMNKRDIKTLKEKTPVSSIDMNKRDLEKLSKSELIKTLLKQKKSKKVHNHEDLLNNDPFKDEVSQPVPQPINLLQKPKKAHST